MAVLALRDPRIRPTAELRIASVVVGLCAFALLFAASFDVIDDDIPPLLPFVIGHFCLAYSVARYPVLVLPLGWCALPWFGLALAWAGIVIMFFGVVLARPQSLRFSTPQASPESE